MQKKKQPTPCPILKMSVNSASTILGLASLVIMKQFCSGYT